MKERPILFSDVMVRAILDGRKTQTRRIVKLPAWTDHVNIDPGGTIFGPGPYLKAHRAEPVPDDVGAMQRVHCPYGYPGDRLWVREAWRTAVGANDKPPSHLEYRGWPTWYDADGAVVWRGATSGGPDFTTPGRGRPSIHMPRWASRITLEIVDVRVQRLQDIREEDSLAEGCDEWIPCSAYTGIRARVRGMRRLGSSAEHFSILWRSIHGDGSWAANPWVWALTFKCVDDAKARDA